VRATEPRGHAEVVRGLWRAAAAGRLAHALCFEGAAGVGKSVAARWFTLGLLCRSGPPIGADARPCGTCPSCKKVLGGDWRGLHPDVFVIDPVEEGRVEIPITYVRQRAQGADGDDPRFTLEEFLALRPSEGERRVVLVREAERLNENAQNALLKTLEEPPRGTTLVLECSRAAALLPTVRSRLVRVPFAPLCEADLRAVLDEARARGELSDAADTAALAALARGAPGAAVDADRRGLAEVRGILVEVATGAARAGERLEALWEVRGEYPGATPSAKERERVRAAAAVAAALVLDLECLAAGLAAVHHADLADRLLPLAHRSTSARRAAAREAALAAIGDVERNQDAAAAMERLVRGLGRLLEAPAT